MKEFLLKLALAIGFKGTVDEGSEEGILNHIKATLKENLDNEKDYAKEISDLKEKLTAKSSELDKAEAKIKELEESKSFIDAGKSFITNVRTEAENLYKTIKGEEVQEGILKLIQTGELTVVQSLLADYKKEMDQISPLKCTKCGSHEISRATAGAGSDDPDNRDVTFKTPNEVRFNRKKKSLSTKRIHEE